MNVINSTDTITRIQLKDKEIILLGTAHVSQESVKEVQEAIIQENPDHVCVELDPGRYKAITEGSKWEDMKIDKVLKEKRGFLLLANLVLSSFQKKLGSELGMNPGSELMAAITTAKENDIPFSLADREIQTTLRRAWAKSSFWNKNKLLATLISTVFTSEKMSKEDIEKLKEKSALQNMMEELANYLPSIKEVLIDERDEYLASKIFNADGKRVLAVIGAGHAPGIIKYIEQMEKESYQADLPALEVIPPASKAMKFVPWVFPVAIVGLMAAGFITAGSDVLIKMSWAWVLVNGGLSAIGAIIALSHPLTVIVSFIAAPFTSLNPFMGVGFVSAYVESIFKRPLVKDFETLSEDIMSVKGFFKNRFTHVLVVLLLTSVGSIIGTGVGFSWLVGLLAG